MRKSLLSVLTVCAALGAARAEDGDPRPALSALRFDEASLLRAFTPEVAKSPRLSQRALALWSHHFAAEAAAIERRFLTEADWRPAFADAARLVDEFLEASELPRAREWPAGRDGHVWVEKLDATGERRTRDLVRGKVWIESVDERGVRTLELRAPFPGLFAPMGGKLALPEPGKKGAIQVTGRHGGRRPSLLPEAGLQLQIDLRPVRTHVIAE